MKTFKRILAAVLCIAVSFSLAACNLVGVDEEKVMSQAVAEVNGVEISKQQFLAMQEQYLYFYQMFGYDPTASEEMLNEFNLNVLESLISQEVMLQKAEELGFMELTAEEQAEADANFETDFASYKENFREQAESEKLNDDTIDVEARIEELAQKALEEGGQTMEEVRKSYADSIGLDKLQKSIYDTVVVTEEDARAWYEENLDLQITEMQTDATAYESYVEGYNGVPALYVPKGYRYVKQILVSFEENAELEAQMTEIETAIASIDTQLAAEDADEAALKAQRADLEAQYAPLLEQYQASAKAKGQEVLDKLAAGADFDSLVAEYNDDPGVAEGGAYAETGYLVGKETTTYVPEFTAAALALKNIGDVSGLVETSYGYHILMLASEVESREIPFEEVKDQIMDIVLGTGQENAWYDKMDEWVAAAKVTRYEDRLADESENYVD